MNNSNISKLIFQTTKDNNDLKFTVSKSAHLYRTFLLLHLKS